jgi:hypothetical protein
VNTDGGAFHPFQSRLPLAAQFIHIIRAAFYISTIHPQSEAFFRIRFLSKVGVCFR